MNRINEAALLDAIEENLAVAEAAAWSEVQDLLDRLAFAAEVTARDLAGDLPPFIYAR